MFRIVWILERDKPPDDGTRPALSWRIVRAIGVGLAVVGIATLITLTWTGHL